MNYWLHIKSKVTKGEVSILKVWKESVIINPFGMYSKLILGAGVAGPLFTTLTRP